MMMALAILLAAAQGPAYDTRMLETGGRADAILAHDLNGDARPDLIVQNGRDLQVFLFREGGLPARADHVVRLGRTIFLWTFGTLDGGRLPALLTAGSRGIHGSAFDGRVFGEPRDLVIHPSLFERPAAGDGPPLHLDFAPDFSGDGLSDALLYTRESIFMMRQFPGGAFRCVGKLPLPVKTGVTILKRIKRNLTETTGVPVTAFGDVDGDGRWDLSWYVDESLGVFRQTASGSFDAMGVMDLSTAKKKRRRRFLRFDLPPKVRDFNGDRLLDLAVIYPSKGRVQVYYGREGRKDFAQPDAIMNVSDGWTTGIYDEDLDGDGKLELVVGVVRKFGIAEGIEVFLSGKVDVELHLYPMQASGQHAKDPVQELKFSIPYALQVTRESATIDLVFRPNFKGDYNGDGLKDLLIPADSSSLAVYPGVRGRLISRKPSGTIRMNTPDGATHTLPFIADFNADGVSDLVLKHVLPGKKGHVLELKLSKPRQR